MEKTKRNHKKLWLIIGIVLAIFVAALLIVPNQLAMAVYRDNFDKRFTTYEPLTWQLEDFDGLLREKHVFPTLQGHQLTGYRYFREGEEAAGVVVLAHGFGGGGHRSYMNIADFFTKNGYTVFAYDATGNDESEGEAVGGLPQGVIDLDYALRYVKESPAFSGLPIMLWGHSWGGYSAGSVLKLHPDVKAAVLVSGFNESLDMLETEGRNIAGDAISFVLPFFEKHEQKTFGDYAAMSVLDGLAATDAKVMIIHSEDDNMIPIEISFDRYFEKFESDDRFTFVRFEDRGHNRVFNSAASFAYIDEYNADANAWQEKVGEITEEMRAQYYETHFDKHRGYELNAELMAQMLAVYKSGK